MNVEPWDWKPVPSSFDCICGNPMQEKHVKPAQEHTPEEQQHLARESSHPVKEKGLFQ